jgi:hypothetical protein
MEERILPNRPTFDIEATADEMEKNTSGTITVKRRFRKTSPSGLNMIASFLKKMPTAAPTMIDPIRSRENPYDFKKGGGVVFIKVTDESDVDVGRPRHATTVDVTGGRIFFEWQKGEAEQAAIEKKRGTGPRKTRQHIPPGLLRIKV